LVINIKSTEFYYFVLCETLHTSDLTELDFLVQLFLVIIFEIPLS